MRKRIFIFTFLLLFVAVLGVWFVKNQVETESVQAQVAQVDYFLKIEGVEGEARDGQIELLSWSWGESEPGVFLSERGVGRGGAFQVNQSDFDFVKRLDKASPLLMQYSASRKTFEEATLIGIKEGGHQFLEIKLKPIYISSYQTGGSSGEVPVDNFSLNFSKIEYKYTPQKDTGEQDEDEAVEGSWDFEKNTEVE